MTVVNGSGTELNVPDSMKDAFIGKGWKMKKEEKKEVKDVKK